jgi:heptose-I-phosphate ethanolaminephosphotransferase
MDTVPKRPHGEVVARFRIWAVTLASSTARKEELSIIPLHHKRIFVRPFIILLVVVVCAILIRHHLQVDKPLILPDIWVEPTRTLNGVEFPSKLWVHRVNTIERAQILLESFPGIEIDVIYDSSSGVFDVRHRDIPSIGLTLREYFEVIEQQYRPLYWIDIKNLNSRNELDQFKRLEWLDAEYDLKNRLVVESPNASSLQRFTESGFNTSYYLPHFDVESATAEVIKDWVRAVKQAVSRTSVHAISADYTMYPLIEKYFNDADALLWASLRYDKASHRKKIEEIINKPRIKVLLVRQPTDFYR